MEEVSLVRPRADRIGGRAPVFSGIAGFRCAIQPFRKGPSMKRFRRLFSLVAGMILVISAVGCAHNPDTRTLDALRTHMIKETGATFLCPMEPGPVHAQSGFSVMLAGKQVAFYRYNLENKKQKAKFDWIRENKKVYIIGNPFTAMINGCFVMIDHDLNPKQDDLQRAFRAF